MQLITFYIYIMDILKIFNNVLVGQPLGRGTDQSFLLIG
jgi:hypothetical protein